MGILDSFKKLFSGDSQADSEPVRTQPRPSPQGTEAKPSAQAEPPVSDSTVNPAGEAEEEEFIDLFKKDD